MKKKATVICWISTALAALALCLTCGLPLPAGIPPMLLQWLILPLLALLTAAVQAHEIVKEYLAVLRGHPAEPAATLTDLLFRDAGHNKSYVVKRMRKGVREARLDYTALAHHGGLTLVRVRLHTGRTHQIRVQFSHRGLPLLGDVRYGSKAPCSPALWSFRLALTHPVTGQPLDVTCPPPDTYPWTDFSPLKEMVSSEA